MSERRFQEALGRGDVVTALVVAPFGYRSQLLGSGYRFTIESGPMRGQRGEGSTLLVAVRNALATPRPTQTPSVISGDTGEPK